MGGRERGVFCSVAALIRPLPNRRVQVGRDDESETFRMLWTRHSMEMYELFEKHLT